MVFFPLDCVLRGFPAAAHVQCASPQNLVRSCPKKKIHIYELDTHPLHQLLVDGFDNSRTHSAPEIRGNGCVVHAEIDRFGFGPIIFHQAGSTVLQRVVVFFLPTVEADRLRIAIQFRSQAIGRPKVSVSRRLPLYFRRR